MFKRRFTRCLDVVQIQEIIEQGVTLPVRCMLNENIKAIVKYQRNRCGTNVLINEWVGNGIADLIGLTIPRYGLCNISETVIRETNENEEIDIARVMIMCLIHDVVEIDAGDTYAYDEAGKATQKEREDVEKKMAEAFSLIPGLSGDEAGNNSLKDLLDPDYEANHFAVQQAHEMLEYMEYVVYLPMLLSIFLIGTAVFELKILQAFAPIAVATIAAEGARSPGVRLLKRYLACFLKIAIYFLIAAVGAEMTKFYYGLITKMSGTTEMTPALVINLVFMLLSNAMAAMAMMQSGGLSNEIIGV